MSRFVKTSTSKYGNNKVVFDGIEFDSRAEARRYAQLLILKKAGLITDLKLQVTYELIPTQVIDGKTARGVKYIADFEYYDLEKQIKVTEDVKGHRTKDYIIKRKLMKYIHNIDVREVKS